MPAAPVRFDDLPVYLRPKLRLFLSADLVGSTAFKQAPSYPITIPDPEPMPGPRWLAAITNFYSAFGAEFARQWSEFVVDAREEPVWRTGPPPEFWKGIGDEVVYSKEIHHPKEVVGTVWAWMKALRRYRSALKAKNTALDIKSTVWLGGFPVNNSEVVFDIGLDSSAGGADDSQVSHFQKLKYFYSANQDRNKFVLDFIGTSVDTGFRLATRSTPRRMTVSIETVLMIVSETIPDHKFGPPQIHFSDYEAFKGVLGGKPYPIFWIDLFARYPHAGSNDDKSPDERLAASEDKLDDREPADPQKLQEFCEAFIERNSQYLIRPFVPGCDEGIFQHPPPNYKARLLEWNEKIEKEISRNLADKDIADSPPADDTSSEGGDGGRGAFAHVDISSMLQAIFEVSATGRQPSKGRTKPAKVRKRKSRPTTTKRSK
jgi:hypothetical protein